MKKACNCYYNLSISLIVHVPTIRPTVDCYIHAFKGVRDSSGLKTPGLKTSPDVCALAKWSSQFLNYQWREYLSTLVDVSKSRL